MLFKKRRKTAVPPPSSPGAEVAQYWTQHNVTSHTHFASAQESLEYLAWRNAQYHNYIELMPVTGRDCATVLDLGCGPGNDLVGFGTASKPSKLIGADVSPTALALADKRLRLHGISAELCALPADSPELPIASDSVDYVHCSGVLHHMPVPEATLAECHRVLRASGEMRVMIYNYESVWLHLYVAYVRKIAQSEFANLDIRSAFSRTTDGLECPIARVHTPAEFVSVAERCGFRCQFLGAAVSMWEMSLLHRRFEATMDLRLPREHRDFLLELTFDPWGYPVYRSHLAGVDACFCLRPA
jgi:ubiquinone/menaquinone biosynthesis C-methylase UbiE